MLETLAGFVLSFLAKLLLGWIEEQKQSAGEREIGRLRAELEQALEALKRQQVMNEIAVRHTTRDDVLARLKEGSA